MPHDPKKLLYDMKEAADRVVRFVGARTFDDFVSDELIRAAVERQFEIIGEAMTRLRKSSPEIAARITNYTKISMFRNILIHDYDVIDYKIAWNIILTHLPILRRELDELLR
jgi:uncharacterized protein with HEPN domain